MSSGTEMCHPAITVEDGNIRSLQDLSMPSPSVGAHLESQIAQYSATIERMHQLQRRSLTRMKPKALEFTFVQISSLTEQTQKLSLLIKSQISESDDLQMLEEFRSIVHRHHQAQVFFYQEYRIYEYNRTIQLLQSGQNINQLTSLLMELDCGDTTICESEEEENAMADSYISFGPFEDEPSGPNWKHFLWPLGSGLLVLGIFWFALDENMVGIEFGALFSF